MVKLYTDEEMDFKCRDYDPIPMRVAQAVLHRKSDPDKINILNGVIKSDIKNGQPPAYVAMYANGIGRMNFGVSADAYLKEYNRFVGEQLVEQENTLIQEQEIPVYDIESEAPEDAEFTLVKPRRRRRKKTEVLEARQMGEEDVDAEEKEEKEPPPPPSGRRIGQQKLTQEEFQALMEGRAFMGARDAVRASLGGSSDT